MKKKIPFILTALVFILSAAGSAGAQAPTLQTLLPGALIPQFVDPLPVAVTGVSVVDATGGGGPGPVGYNIHMKEFQAQILPSTGVPLAVPPIPANTPSWVWGYLTDTDVAAQEAPSPPVRPSYLGPVVVAKKSVETHPTYINALPYGLDSKVQRLLPTDQTLDWADPLGTGCIVPPPLTVAGDCASIYLGPQPTVPHIHGGEVAPLYDGGPDAWWLPINPITTVVGTGSPAAPGTGQATFIYPTQQQAGTIWFHDHALGITRLNVYAGMAGLYIITDPAASGGFEPATGVLPAFPQHDIPLIIQDRSFDTAGQIFYNLASNPQPNPTVHPFWIPEFIGDAILVNGKTWPFLEVEPRQYRFRFVNGSNARFYDLRLSNAAPFLVIATDDGYLNNPVSTPNLIIGPGERYEVIVDFRGFAGNANILLTNSARTPFPGGGKVVTGTTDRVMQFRVNKLAVGDQTNVTVLTNLRPTNPIINIKGVLPAIKRQLTLNEVIGPGGPLELVLNNTKYNGVVAGFLTRDTEQPAVGDTEIWEIINITADAHPIHTHLASFQIVSRQAFQATKWTNVYTNALAANSILDGQGPPNAYLTPNRPDGAIGGNPPLGPYLQAKKLTLPLPYENGWKDTVISYPGEVTRIMVRWAPTDAPTAGAACGPCGTGTTENPVPVCSPGCAPGPGSNLYPFNPTELIGGVGYVWHCHIVDHEDNEMMRPYVLGTARQ